MEKFPPYIKGVIEGGKSEKSLNEKTDDLKSDLEKLSPEARIELESILNSPDEDEIIFDKTDKNEN